MAKTPEQLDKATNQRLLKKYGRGLDWFNSQPQTCRICGDSGKTRRLNIDHDHSWVKVKIFSVKNTFQGWDSEATYRGVLTITHGNTKSEAIKAMKEILKRESVRGLLCHRCNRALIMLRDRVDLMEKGIEYLEEFSPQYPPSSENWCDGCDGTGLMEGWNRRDGFSCPKCKGKGAIKT